MNSPRYPIARIQVQAFRAFLHPQSFDFSRHPSLAVFAPNGYGKSSVIDALEFLFSSEGTLKRLGTRNINNKAGLAALAHNLTEGSGLTPGVTVTVNIHGTIDTVTRRATGQDRTIPVSVSKVEAEFVVDPIIRGFTLRAFVEDETPEQRYASIAGWLNLQPLVDAQKNLRALRLHVKSITEDTSWKDGIDQQIRRETSGSLTAWSDTDVIDYIDRELLNPLDPRLHVKELRATDPGLAALAERAAVEETSIGLAALKQRESQAVRIHGRQPLPETDDPGEMGAIAGFVDSHEKWVAASDEERLERAAAAEAVFQSVWSAAEPLFEAPETAPTSCPVCLTPIESSTAGSTPSVHDHLRSSLERIRAYAAAKRDLETAATILESSRILLTSATDGLRTLLTDGDAVLSGLLVDLRDAARAWVPPQPLPQSEALIEALDQFIEATSRSIAIVEGQRGQDSYARAIEKVNRLLALEAEVANGKSMALELGKLSLSLSQQATAVSASIRAEVQTRLDQLQEPMNSLYTRIQGTDAPRIHLSLPPEDDTNQQRLHLLIDFASNRRSVQPSGYLSDSQIHSIALALRVAAVRTFNSGAPLIALDDVVTSYDADHRRAIAGLIADELRDFQVIITTHDERFFNYLKDQLPHANWNFRRITGLSRQAGPQFADHKVTDELIDERWSNGDSAANEIRQAEEEWLLTICRDFGVSLRIRPLEKPYAFERAELASALAAFLKGVNLVPSATPGVQNRYLDSLVRGEIENFGSHFQDGPYGSGSIGDEQARWKEFQSFRQQFACTKCGRTRFHRPLGLTRPSCRKDTCETPFAFTTPDEGQ